MTRGQRQPAILLTVTAVWLLLCALGCQEVASLPGTVERPPGSQRVPRRVVCTTGHVAEMVREVGGASVQVEALMGYGVDPHLYKPSHGDLRKLQAADAVFYNGLHLEGRVGEVLENLARRKPVVAVVEEILARDPSRLRAASQFAGNYDPHIWFDVALWADCVPHVVQKLAEFLPAERARFESRGAAYRERLLAVDAEVRERLARVPRERRTLVTAHDAFEYFGRAYDVDVFGLQGISTADEANLKAMNRLVDLIVERKVKAVFVETSVPAKQIEALIAGCRARGQEVRIGGELYSDALGPVGSDAETYLGMIRHNSQTIAAALE